MFRFSFVLSSLCLLLHSAVANKAPCGGSDVHVSYEIVNSHDVPCHANKDLFEFHAVLGPEVETLAAFDMFRVNVSGLHANTANQLASPAVSAQAHFLNAHESSDCAATLSASPLAIIDSAHDCDRAFCDLQFAVNLSAVYSCWGFGDTLQVQFETTNTEPAVRIRGVLTYGQFAMGVTATDPGKHVTVEAYPDNKHLHIKQYKQGHGSQQHHLNFKYVQVDLGKHKVLHYNGYDERPEPTRKARVVGHKRAIEACYKDNRANKCTNIPLTKAPKKNPSDGSTEVTFQFTYGPHLINSLVLRGVHGHSGHIDANVTVIRRTEGDWDCEIDPGKHVQRKKESGEVQLDLHSVHRCMHFAGITEIGLALGPYKVTFEAIYTVFELGFAVDKQNAIVVKPVPYNALHDMPARLAHPHGDTTYAQFKKKVDHKLVRLVTADMHPNRHQAQNNATKLEFGDITLSQQKTSWMTVVVIGVLDMCGAAFVVGLVVYLLRRNRRYSGLGYILHTNAEDTRPLTTGV